MRFLFSLLLLSCSCPDFSYLLDLELFAGLEPVVFDVGCNKGYDTAMMFEAFAAQVRRKCSQIDCVLVECKQAR